MVKEVGINNDYNEVEIADFAHEYLEMLRYGTCMRVRFFLASRGIIGSREIDTFKYLLTVDNPQKTIPW